MNKNNDKKLIKSEIYYSRTYKHLIKNLKITLAFIIFFTTPILYILLKNYTTFTKYFSIHLINLLKKTNLNFELTLSKANYIPYFGKAYFVNSESFIPNKQFIFLNLIISIILIIFFLKLSEKFKPISICSIYILLIHTLNSFLFLIFPNLFNTTITDFSKLLIQQQISILIIFFLLSNILIATYFKNIKASILMIFSLIIYSIIFNFFRYGLFLIILYKFSYLYMSILFFAFGPFIDFIYFIWIYSIYMTHLSNFFNKDRKDTVWQWT